MKRIAPILVISILAIGLGAAAWLLSRQPDFRPGKRTPSVAQVQAPDFLTPPTDPDSLIGSMGRRSDTARWISLGGDPGDPPRLIVNQEYPGFVILELELPGFFLEPVTVTGRRASRISVPGLIKLRSLGLPELPVLSRSLAMPGGESIRVRILDHVVKELAVDPVEPSKGHLDRSRDPATVPAVFSGFYAGGETWPAEPTVLGRPFILRDQRGVNIRLQPLRYDAAAGRLLISKRLVLEITTDGTAGLNKTAPRASAEFAFIYDRLFSNYDEPSLLEKYQSLPTRGRMLIVTDPAFVEDLEPFIEWKQRLGIEVEMRTTAQTGDTAEAISQAMQAMYDAPEGLTWAILVGDKAQIPPHIGLYDGSDSDSRYALLAGQDEYPDIYISRISADSRSQVQTQVAKFIAYEMGTFSDPQTDWYGRSVGIAGDEGIPADYERVELLRSDLLANGFHTVDRMYQNLGGTTAGIRIAIEEGCSLINYLGHGTGTSWSSISFGISDVQNLTNTGLTPWIVDVSCSNGDFGLDECFAEAWLRAGTAAEPRGAVAVVSATSLAPWVPPTVMQAEIVDLLTARQANTLGSLYYGGLMKVLDLYAGLPVAVRVMEQNVVFGDCSLMVRTAPPQDFVITDPSPLIAESSNWTATIAGNGESVAGSVVTLTRGGLIYGIGFVAADGVIAVPITRSMAGVPQLEITVSGFNMTPFLGTIELGSGEISVLEPENDSTEPTDQIPGTIPRLLGNYPNPFNPETRIVFELPDRMRVRLRVFDIRGRHITTLIDESRSAGRQEAAWNGRTSNGAPAASGIYLYRLETEVGHFTGRMTLGK